MQLDNTAALFHRAERDGWAHWIKTRADEEAVLQGCYFDIAKGNRVVEFIERFLWQTKNVDRPRNVRLFDWQKNDIILPLFSWQTADHVRRFRQAFIEIPKKNGKALDITTPIPTPSGWKMLGDITSGDQVFDENGLPCNVVATTEVMVNRPCYKLTFSDGTAIVADAQHEWKTKTRKPEDKTAIWTTEQIANSLRVDSPGSEGSNHSIPVAGALALDSVTLPIEPYTLGVWLGDGTRTTGQFTFASSDAEIVEHLEAAGTTVRVSNNSSGNCVGLLNPRKSQRKGEDDCFRVQARKLGVLNNKHIPPQYLRASFSQRLALLHGLMDTDGTCSKRGECSVTTISARLRDDVLELIRSLGLKPTSNSKECWIGDKYCGVAFNIRFCAFADMPVFRLRRKKARQKQRPDRLARSTNRHIVSCEPVESVPVKCIQVDSPSHLFLAGEGFIATHNSFLASAIVLYLLMADGEQRAEVYSMAYDKKNARTVFDECRINAEGSPQLNPLLTVTPHKRRIDYGLTNSFYEVLSADQGQRNEGFDISGLVIDELHTLRKAELFEALRYGGATRRQPLSVYITTAGNEKNSVAYDLHEHALAILNGYRTNIDFFPYVRAASSEDDISSVETWRKANPMLGLTMPEKVFRAEYEEAAVLPTRLAAFKRYRLNIWPDKNEGAWLSMKHWNACGQTKYKAEDLEGQTAYMAVDVGLTDDLFSALMLLPQADGTYKLLPYFWCSRENAKQKNKFDPYLLWAGQGHIRIVDEEAVTFERVRTDIVELGKKFNIEKIAFDPWQANDLQQQLANEGFTTTPFRQTFQFMTEPCRRLEQLVLTGKLHHGSNPVLDWMASNATLQTDSTGSMRVKKPSAKSRKKCDGIVALLMALGIAQEQEAPSQRIEIIR